MIHIRPISDLENKYPEIEELVLNKNEAVYLTKNGYGSMVVMSIEKYAQLTDNIEFKLDATDKEAESTNKKYTHKENTHNEISHNENPHKENAPNEIFSNIRMKMDEK